MVEEYLNQVISFDLLNTLEKSVNFQEHVTTETIDEVTEGIGALYNITQSFGDSILMDENASESLLRAILQSLKNPGSGESCVTKQRFLYYHSDQRSSSAKSRN